MTACSITPLNTITILCDPLKHFRLDVPTLSVVQTSVMDALVIFSGDNTHPMSWLLNKKRRHVWCSVRDTERNHWITYDWDKGIPKIRCDAAADFDLKSYYEQLGFEVIETTVGATPPHGPLQWNNCVGHVKTILAIDTYALVPNGLYTHLTRKPWSFLNLSFAPGFGGMQSAAAPLPAPVAVAPVAPQSDMAKSAERNLSDADQKRLKLGKYKPVAPVKKKTLLSATNNNNNDNGGNGDGFGGYSNSGSSNSIGGNASAGTTV